MRSIPILAVVTAIALSGCALPDRGGVSTEAVALTPFTWKGNTPRATRRADISECELAARGLPPNPTPQMLERAVRGDPEQEARFVNACLTNKGYTVTDLPVCNDALRAQGQMVVQPDIMPPLQNIRCVDPFVRGFVVA